MPRPRRKRFDFERYALDPEFAWLFSSEEIAVAAQTREARLAQREYLTVREAAEFARVGYSTWRQKVQPIFPPGVFLGKRLYRRTDVQAFIEQAAKWQRSTGAASPTTSSGMMRKASTASPLDKYRNTKPRRDAKTKS